MSQGETGETGATGAAGAAGAEGAVGRTGQQGEPGPAAMLDPKTAAEIKRGMRTLVAATVALYLALFGIVIFTYVDSKNKRDDITAVATVSAKVTTQTTRALCNLRSDLVARRDASIAFKKEHPDGIPGISAASIQMSIGNTTRTIESLAVLHCPPPKVP